MPTCTSAGGGGGFSAADKGQIATMNKLQDKFQVGSRGISTFGGSGFTITEKPEFRMRKDGFIEYKVVSEQRIVPQKSSTIGVGDTRGEVITQTQTGRILKNANGSAKSLVVEDTKRKRTAWRR